MLNGIHSWADRQKAHNPSYSLAVGKKVFTVDQIVEHIEKGTPEGKDLVKRIMEAAADLFVSGE